MVMINPEYGERLGVDKDLEEIYTAIGDFFKKNAQVTLDMSLQETLNLPKVLA